MRSEKFTDLLSAIVDNRGRTCPVGDSGIPLIATNCIRNELLYPALETVRFVDQRTFDTWFRGHPQPGDIIFVCKGSPGRVCLAPNPVGFCIAQDMVAVRPDATKVYPRYLFALLRSRETQERIANLHVGTLIPHFKKGDFDKLILEVPDVATQRFVGDLYFALSAKIDRNRRMNRTLEQLAQVIFESWFGGRAGAEDSSNGRAEGVTEAVSACSVAELVECVVERVDPTLVEDDDRYIALDDMPSRSIDLSCHRSGREVSSSIIRFRKGDILFGSMRPYFHKVGLAPYDGITRTTTFVLRPRESYLRHFLLMNLFSDEVIKYSSDASVGTTIPYVKWEALGRYRVAPPSRSVALAFERALSPLTQRIANNGAESRTLAALRDTLLPKLISGELRVPDAEAAVSEAL